MIGSTISHYKITEKLGEGGMGIVYKARDLNLERDVALKFLSPQLTSSDEEKKRFIHEARAASSLDHPNICAIYEIGQTDDEQLFMAMAHYDGETLDRKIEGKPLAIDRALDITIQIAQGLAKAHEKKIIHRDIKPANIMLTADGVVKILDFGLAKLGGQTKLTKEGTTLGTVAYMSPEQTRGEKIDWRSDLWSLGVILYEMISGQLPFQGDYDQALMYGITNETPQPLTALRSGLPLELERIVKRLLEKDPRDRYQHADDLSSELNKLKRDSDSVMAPLKPGTPPIKTSAPSKKKKKVWIPLILASVTIIIIGAYWLFWSAQEEAPSDTAPDVSSSEWENSIAVLPFENISNDPQQEYFCDGMTEQIITNLVKLRRLKVIGRTSVMTYKNTDKKLPQIGQELNVAYILEGSVRKYGDRIRVTAQLINSKDGFHLWSEDYDKDYQDLFDIQDDVSQLIASSLLQQFSEEEVTDIKMIRPQNTQAYEYFMKGKYYHWNKFFASYKSENLVIAENLLIKATKTDPLYADAYAALADLYNTYYNISAEERGGKQKLLYLQKAYLDTARQLKGQSVDFYVAKSGLHKALVGDYYAKGEFVYAVKELDKAFESLLEAIRVNRNDDRPYWDFAVFFWKLGLYPQMSQCFERAIELNPLDENHYAFYLDYSYWFGQYDNVEQIYQRLLEIVPHQLIATRFYFMTQVALKKNEKAEQLFILLDSTYYKGKKTELDRASLYALKGEHKKALALLDNKGIFAINVHALLGLRDEVIEGLERNLERHKILKTSTWRYFWMQTPLFDKIRPDPRFQQILEEYRQMYEYNLQKYGDFQL